MLDLAGHMADAQTYNGKTLSERLAGRFYTPSQLADDLAEQMVLALDPDSLSRITAADPFCGDGRLMTALLSAAANHPKLANLPWTIELRDRELAAAKTAVDRVRAVARRLGMVVEPQVIVGDTFACDISARFHLVITNPPWELLKPDRREFQHLLPAKAESYKEGLRATSRWLDSRFPDARADGAWGGWGTNLARCGWDLCLRIACKGGVVGIILPATIMGDQSSISMRRKAFGSAQLIDAATYPSEARLFDRVDQPVVALTMRARTRAAGAGRVRFFDADRIVAGQHAVTLDRPAMEARGWTIPVGRPSGCDHLSDVFKSLPTLRSLEGNGPGHLWLGRELDETRILEKVKRGTRNPFIKGRMVGRHEVAEQPTMSVLPSLCTGFHSTAHPRAVWRDVARATSKRRMIGTVIPAGWVAGNSLHVACFRDGNLDRTLTLHALLTSFVVEGQVRARLTTGHMSLGIVRQAHVPHLSRGLVAKLAPLARDTIAARDASSEHRLEVAVAKAYGLDRHQMARLLDDFPKLDGQERDALTCAIAWRECCV